MKCGGAGEGRRLQGSPNARVHFLPLLRHACGGRGGAAPLTSRRAACVPAPEDTAAPVPAEAPVLHGAGGRHPPGHGARAASGGGLGDAVLRRGLRWALRHPAGAGLPPRQSEWPGHGSRGSAGLAVGDVDGSRSVGGSCPQTRSHSAVGSGKRAAQRAVPLPLRRSAPFAV